MKRRWNLDRRERIDARERAVAALLERDEEIGTLPAPAPAGAAAHQAPEGDTWAIVLAGGEGRRLQAFTMLRDGVAVPKQFCRFRDERTLLAATIDRALRVVPVERVIVVVLEAHREWWQPELAHLPAANVLSQPMSRGTAVALLHALVHIHLQDSAPRILVMPSDHDVEDESTLMRTVGRALRTAVVYPEGLVVLGIAPTHLDTEYGLIVPGPGPANVSRPVHAFVEKPTLTTAAELVRSGAMWNSFILAGTGTAMYGAFEVALPSLARGYLRGLAASGGDPECLARLFEALPEADFCRDVLPRDASRLRLMTVPPCGWTDLGTPARLAAWLDRHREAPFWREHRVPRRNGPDGLAGALQAGGA